MRRKLIKQEVFDQIANSSVVFAEHELIEAERIVSKAVGHHTKLHSFNESTVLYETDEDTYLYANYKIDEGNVSFSNIEELVIDEESKANKRKNILGEMLDSLLKDKSEVAQDLFKDYMKVTTFSEAKKFVVKAKEDEGSVDFEVGERDDKKKLSNQLPEKKTLSDKLKDKKNKDKKEKSGSKELQFDNKKDAFKKKLKAAGKKIEEAYSVASNVLDYVDYLNVGPVLAETKIDQDDNGNVVALKVPTSKVRNEGKILNFDWKVLNHKCKVMRSGAKNLSEDQGFIRSIATLKVQNNVSNAAALEECLDEIALKWPNVLYLSQSELAALIGEALQIAGERNFDDQTCTFMAEGILRKVHGNYSDRVNQILHLANVDQNESAGEDSYEKFQSVVENFYPFIDQKYDMEIKVFADLYESLSEINKIADRRGDNMLKSETASMLNDLASVLNDQARPDVELAEEVATWLTRFIEANVSGSSNVWSVVANPHHTVNGDHPQMSRNAGVPAYASAHEGDWGDSAPMIGQDDMNYKGKHSDQARNNSWGNSGGSDTFPSLKNPYIPSSLEFTMKGESGVDKETFGQHGATWQSGDTWPALQNPYTPKPADVYKMKE